MLQAAVAHSAKRIVKAQAPLLRRTFGIEHRRIAQPRDETGLLA
jgi:hypothetical protein